MKNIIYSILVCLPFVFGACDKSTDDTSKVTYFVTLEREGDEKIVLEKGQPYVEPGYYAEMNGEDITESVQIKGSICGIQRGRFCQNIYTNSICGR